MSKLQDARSTEHQARSKVASMRRMLQVNPSPSPNPNPDPDPDPDPNPNPNRMLQDARTEHAKAELRERRWAEAAAYRAQQVQEAEA